MERKSMSEGRIGIIGSGKMGSNLAHYLVDQGFDIAWSVRPGSDFSVTVKTLHKKAGRLHSAGIIDGERLAKLQHTPVTDTMDAIRDCSLVIECVNEDAGLKKKVLAAADEVLSRESILVSNSSSILPSLICPSESRSSNFAGLHFFYPIGLVDVVEITETAVSSAETRQRLEDFCKAIRRRYLLLNEDNAFILNRIFLEVQNEAFRICMQGNARYEEIDQAVRESLFPSGIFGFFDHVGLDIMLYSIRNYVSGYPHADYYAPLIERLGELVSQGMLGKKAGKGFFDYSGAEAVENPSEQGNPDSKELRKHLEYTYRNAARRYIARSGLTIDELNEALKEYFGTETGPFD